MTPNHTHDHPHHQPADLVLMNGKVITVDDACPVAQAVAVQGDTIAAVGSNQQIWPFIGSGTLVLDLDGRLAVPGFIEGHAHLTSMGQAMEKLDLRKAQSWPQIVDLVRRTANSTDMNPGQWIHGSRRQIPKRAQSLAGGARSAPGHQVGGAGLPVQGRDGLARCHGEL